MKQILHAWQVPRSDKRDRCAKCLRPFKVKQIRHKIKGLSASTSRFPNECHACHTSPAVVVSDTK